MEKPAAVDHTLTSVAQKLIDACSTSSHNVQSEVTKQIMKQDVGELQTWVQNYYQEIHSLPSQDTKEFKDFLDDENQLHKGEFNTMAAVEMLWSYVKQVINITTESISMVTFKMIYFECFKRVVQGSNFSLERF